MTLATQITLLRTGFSFVAIGLLYWGSASASLIAMVLIALAIGLDALDGRIARSRNEVSTAGAIIDIAGDRLIETLLWVAFADLGAIPIWVPMLVIARGALVDSIRAIGYSRGQTAFGTTSVTQGEIGRWLTGGRSLRAFYGSAKLVAFVFLAGYVAWQQFGADFSLSGLYDEELFRGLGWIFVWSSVLLTVIRGLPLVWQTLQAQSLATPTHPDPRIVLTRLPDGIELEERPSAHGIQT